DAPQTMAFLAFRVEPIRKLYYKFQFQYFDRFYSEFNPFNLKGDNAGRDSWKIPSYHLLNAFVGYKIVLKNNSAISLNASVINLLNKKYIADAALSSIYGTGFDINSVGVMYGQGLKFNVSIGFEF